MRKNNLNFCVAIANQNSSVPVALLVEKPTHKTVVLNDSYEAVVSKEEVKVGCQTFPIEKVKEILAAHAELD
jgi:hypothetical protein